MNVFLEHMIVRWIQVFVPTLKDHMAVNVCLVMKAMEEMQESVAKAGEKYDHIIIFFILFFKIKLP